MCVANPLGVKFIMKKLIALLIVLLNVSMAYAEHCYYESYKTDPVYEAYYTQKMCNQSFVNEAWSLFDFDKGD